MAFDARNPPDVLAVIQGDGAAGAIKIDKNGAPWIDGKVGKLGFEVDFTGCDAHGLNCKRAFYAMAFDMSSITLDQINGWNRSSIVCPAYLTTANHPRVWYGLIRIGRGHPRFGEGAVRRLARLHDRLRQVHRRP